jgi:hypothetical protein
MRVEKPREGIEQALRYDALSEAEKVTGLSYKEDEGTMGLGLALHILAGDAKRNALSAADDTWFSIPIADALRIIALEGFELLVEQPFTGTDWGSNSVQEKWFIFYHYAEGILVFLDTFNGDHINSGSAYYNWKSDYSWQQRPEYDPDTWAKTGRMLDVFAPTPEAYACVGRGGFFGESGQLCWAGSHDIREGFRHRINKLRANGNFVSPWKKQPFMWLLDYVTVHGADKFKDDYAAKSAFYAENTAARIARLPEDVQAAIASQEAEV